MKNKEKQPGRKLCERLDIETGAWLPKNCWKAAENCATIAEWARDGNGEMLRVGSVNVGTLWGRGREVVKMINRR